MLEAIFYTRFHPLLGRKVIHQVPDGCIIPSQSRPPQSLFTFTDISPYLIPPYTLCNAPLSFTHSPYRVIGYPISIEKAHYERNRFTFNVAFVIDENEDARVWEAIVAKTAFFFRALEDDDSLLQGEENLTNLPWAGAEGYPARDVGVIFPLLKSIYDNLLAYGETYSRVDDTHTLNLRLPHLHNSTTKVRAWDVPLLIRPLPTQDQWDWDLALRATYNQIDGVQHVQRIAEKSNVDARLVKRVVAELVFNDRAILLEHFHFQAVYVPTRKMASFARNQGLLEECQNYVSVGDSRTDKPGADSLIEMYSSLSPGTTLNNWVLAHKSHVHSIDVRRFVTFGVIKGFLRRIQKFPMAIASANGTGIAAGTQASDQSNDEYNTSWTVAASRTTDPVELPVGKNGNNDKLGRGEKVKMKVDGEHCTDEICVNAGASERKLMEEIDSGRFGEVVVLKK
ncbi:nitrogen permease regulator 2 [Piedraia hortae CBS 480.64]|uniref:Nitrogen permease regulator 2 n=1 Tax=Piedraia hortae CBS 480.64 TaxID=1314780 RepID=A0A6A7BSA0_9PEZI|nr:nitrogen permease regulator 2 [Piedraia hortae CBS 480.64]